VLAVLSGLPLLIAHVAPGSVEELMPEWGVILWGWSLTLGSAGTLVAMAKQTTNAIIGEQIGSVTVGAACIIYGACVIIVGGLPAAFAGAVTAGFGASCFYRWLQLQALLLERVVVVEAVRRGDCLGGFSQELDR